MLVLGDAHADDQSNRRALIGSYDEVDTAGAIQLGDLLWYKLPLPTWFIAGNNEDFDVIDALRAGEHPENVTNAHLLASSTVELEGLRIAGLSGNYAPTQYEKPRSELVGGRRRHFVREDVERAKRLSNVDVFLTHEAPHGLLHTEEYDVGCTYIDDLLRDLTPALCLVGHHHQHVESNFGETDVIGLAPAWESYYTLSSDPLSLTRHPSPHP